MKKVKFHKCYKELDPPLPKPCKFEKLNVTTHTIMVYTNIIFDTAKIFWELPIYIKEFVIKTKSDRKNILAPYGAILGVQSNTLIRGLPKKKIKKVHCTVCRQMKVTSNDDENIKGKKMKYITEIIVQDSVHKHVYHILYYCSYCDKVYKPFDIKKINHFPHQVTVLLSVGTTSILNIMIFKDTLKIAGAKSKKDAMEAVHLLWDMYLNKRSTPKGCSKLYSLAPKYSQDTSVKFLFDIVMMNVGFCLGFPMNRRALNDLMNQEKYSDIIDLSCLETTSNPNVKIKIIAQKPENFYHDCLIIPLKNKKKKVEKPYMIKCTDNEYKKVKKEKIKYITVIIFSSSETILTGRYADNLAFIHDFLVRTIYKHNLIQTVENPNVKKIKKALR